MQRVQDWLRRQDSLFVRMLALQAALAIGLSMLYFGVYFIDRNRTVAALLADRWAPVLRHAAGLPEAPATPPALDTGNTVLRRTELPAEARQLQAWAPRVQMLTGELGRRGVHIDAIAWTPALLSPEGGEPVVWVHVLRPGQAPLWLGASGPFIENHVGRSLVLMLIVGTALVIGLSWFPARRMTQRLDSLRERIRAGRLLPPLPPDLAATPEIVEIERAYDELQMQVQDQQRERALLLAGVSHDLRSPLGRIRMAAELLPEGPAVDAATLAARRASIIANVQAADRLIESFLDLVRSTELPLDEAVDVAAVARQVVADFERPAAELRADAPDAVVLPQAHQHLIERALFNLVDNALKHGRPPVTLRVVDAADTADAEIRIEVEDHGPGIPEASRTGLLAAFARGDASRGSPGSGLGLAIVRQVADRLGGRIDFVQRPAVGDEPGVWVTRIHLPRPEPTGLRGPDSPASWSGS